ncbi:MAG: hypothetical protein Q7T89_05560 [Anaerolineales bacterium]|nr:hypothetical protein [Anaerolineales bacterium]
MASVQQSSIEKLRYKIAGIIENHEVWATLHDVTNALGFQNQEVEGLGKSKYLIKVTNAADEKVVISAAKQIINSYPGTRGKPSAEDLQIIQDALWWIEGNGVQEISNVTRYKIAEGLESIPFWGRLSIAEFFYPVLPALAAEHSLPEIGKDGFLYEGTSWMSFLNLLSGNKSKPLQPSRISISEFLRKAGIADWPDERLFLLIEQMVHPEIQSFDLQKKLVAQFNALLQHDNFELRQEGLESGVPVYKVRRKGVGVLGTPKYIIFASTGSKPDIVIDDAVNMDIRIIRYVDQCLVYDQPPPQDDLTWQTLVEWWSAKKGANVAQNEIRQELGLRLRVSLQSEPERMLYDTYFKIVKSKYGMNLPALLPQVYLHYDPRNRNERGKPILVRQRMDFLMLLRNATRIVIEIDGAQHYSDDGRASPSRYAEMVAEDRRIRILGYEIYRFGGAEFKSPEQASKTIATFFDELFARHKIRPE